MTKLYKVTGEQLSMFCGVSPPASCDALLIKNRTLGGGYHIQSIGTAIKSKQVQVVVSLDNSNAISDMYAAGEKVKLTDDERYYVCLINEAPSWKYEAKNVYSSKLTLMITEEGAL